MRSRRVSLQHEDCRIQTSAAPLVIDGRPGMKRTRVLLADDDSHVRASITTILQVDFEVVGSVPDGRSLIEAAARLRPDVVVTDISMPKLDGIEAARTIHSILPDIK